MTSHRQEWTPARKAELETLWAAGHTTTRIAELMGLEGGKNAVIGKARRLGLEKRKSYSRSREEYKRMREEQAALQAMGLAKKRARGRPQTKLSPVGSLMRDLEKAAHPRVTKQTTIQPVPVEEPVSRNIPFSKRLSGIECAWIAGEPTAEATCCGHRCKAKSQYCVFHHGIVWRPAESR